MKVDLGHGSSAHCREMNACIESLSNSNSFGNATVAIVGSGGRLGATCVDAWRERMPLLTFSRAEVDLANVAAVDSAMEQCAAAGVHVIVNASGMTNLEICEDEPELAHRVNAAAVKQMAEACARNKIRFLHFSTDYVFDGEKKEPYCEEDAPCPISTYGKTKLAGERATLEADGGHMVFRVAWVFGAVRPSFPDMVISRALEGGEVAVVADKWASPTSAMDVAGWLLPLVQRAADPALSGGLFHLCNTGVCSWMEYAVHSLETAQSIGLPVSTTKPKPLALAEMKIFRAPRPIHSGMNNMKFQRNFGASLRPWQDALSEFIRQNYSKP